MKKILILGLMTFAVSITSCTFNVSTGTNSANTTNSVPATAENKTATTTNTATAPKKEEGDSAKKPETASNSADGIRVQFAKGETSTSVTKDIPPNGSVDFIMNVQKGQTMGYTVGYDFKDSDIEAFLNEPGLQDFSETSGPKEPQEFVVKKSGDHRLTVNNTTGKRVTITLYLDVN